MSYPVATPVYTFLLDTEVALGAFGSPVYLWVRYSDGELATLRFNGYRDAMAWAESHDATVLAVVEAEEDASTGEASAYTVTR